MNNILEVKAASRSFTARRGLLDILMRKPAATLQAVRGVDLDIKRRTTLGIVGESGCGKSTLARLIAGLYPCTDGEIHLEGRPLSGPDANGRIQMVFQDPYSSLNPRLSVGSLLVEVIARYQPELSGPERDAEVRATLERVGLSADTSRKYPHALSGGQRQRVSIARALCTNPEILVADEPVSALDASVQAKIINLFQQLNEDGITIIFISHDMQVIAHLCDQIAVMYLGQVVELQSADALFETPLHPYTQGLIASVPQIGKSRRAHAEMTGELPDPFNVPTGCAFANRCPLAEDPCRQPQKLRPISDGFVRCWKAEAN